MYYTEEQRKAAAEKNRKNYHTDAIRIYEGKVVATSYGWDYVLKIYNDNSASLYCIGKNGHGDCFWAGTHILKSHLIDLQKYDSWKNEGTIIPKDWEVLEPGFFEALNIA